MSLTQSFNAAAAASSPLALGVSPADLGRQLLDLVKRPMDGASANLNINQEAQDLLRKGASLDVRDEQHGRTAVIWATIHCRAKILGAILEKQPALDARGDDGMTAMDHALKNKNRLAIGLLQKAQGEAKARLMQDLGDVRSRRDFVPMKPMNVQKRHHNTLNRHGQGKRG